MRKLYKLFIFILIFIKFIVKWFVGGFVMAIKYFVFNSNLLGKKTNIGKVTDLTDYTTKDLIERMTQGKTGLGKADIEAFFNIFKDTVFNICKEGGSINIDGFMSILPSMSGSFESESSGFDPTRNSVYIIAKISSALNEQFRTEALVEKVQATERRPMLSEVIDLESGSINKEITKNNIITIKGENLKFNSKSTDEYLEIINVENESEIIRISKFQKITDKEVVFLCPDLRFTKARIEIGSLMATKTLRVGESDVLEVK